MKQGTKSYLLREQLVTVTMSEMIVLGLVACHCVLLEGMVLLETC